MQVNPWSRFRGLQASETTIIATVNAHNPDGTSTLTTPEGYDMRAIGRDVAIGSNAYVTAGRITGAAPQLPVVDLTV